jgi:hypothetical protein
LSALSIDHESSQFGSNVSEGALRDGNIELRKGDIGQRYGAMGLEERAINNEFRDNPYNDEVKESSDNLFLDEDEVEDNVLGNPNNVQSQSILSHFPINSAEQNLGRILTDQEEENLKLELATVN